MGLCQPCLREDRVTPFKAVDHIKPKAQGGTDDDENLQCICNECHDAKTAKEAVDAQGRRISDRPTFDALGRVVWSE